MLIKESVILLDGILQHQGAEINESHVVTNNINECPNVTHLKLKFMTCYMSGFRNK